MILPWPRSLFKTPLCHLLKKLNAQVALIGMPFNFGRHAATGSDLRRPGTFPGACCTPNRWEYNQKPKEPSTLMPARNCARA